MKFLQPAILLALAASAVQGAIVATEVGSNAPGTDSANEYVVILNNGASSVDLSGYDISDSTGSWDSIGSITIAAGQSLVISSGATASELTSAWGESIPLGSLFTIVNGLASFNNTSNDVVQLRDASDTVIYTFTYDYELADDSPATAIGLGATGGGPGGTSITPFSTVSTVPELTTALLGSFAMLILLRRRRR